MLLRLQRQAPTGAAIHGKLYIDGTYFCDTLERVGVQIPALWYTVAVTQSPRFKRLLPIVERVPGRTGIRFHVGTKPSHSAGCILVPDKATEDRLVSVLKQRKVESESESQSPINNHKSQITNETIYLDICDYRPNYEL